MTGTEILNHSPLRQLAREMAQSDELVLKIAKEAASHVNSNRDKNVYITLDDLIRQAEALPRRFPDPEHRPLLYGVPVSVKDCFDLKETVTTAGSLYYAGANAPATENSWVVEQLLASGAIIVGKTHMQELAYGITGENSWLGDCCQPNDPALLTGGSSSGAAASVQEKSAMAAIGTDTAGSVRVPAVLCGLAGYRSSLGAGLWDGGMHLAKSFDTISWVFRDLRDAPVLVAAMFGFYPSENSMPKKVGVITEDFFADSCLEIQTGFENVVKVLSTRCHELRRFKADFWEEALSIFAPIQAHEAAELHQGRYKEFEPAIRDRLEWGASLTDKEIEDLRGQRAKFELRMNELFSAFDFLLLPCSPVSALIAGEDQSPLRPKILRYTVPVSLAGLPALTLPGGVQLVGRHGRDAELVTFAATLNATG